MAEVNWKAKREDLFVEDAVFKIAITNLFSANAQETINLEKEDLEGTVIYVYNPVFDTKFFNGEPKNILKCQWYFVSEPAAFITKKNVM